MAASVEKVATTYNFDCTMCEYSSAHICMELQHTS